MAETAEKDLAGTKVVSAAGERVGRISRLLVYRGSEDPGRGGKAEDDAEQATGSRSDDDEAQTTGSHHDDDEAQTTGRHQDDDEAQATGSREPGTGGEREERWALVRLGMLGLHTAIVPLEGSDEEGGHLRVPYELEWIRQVPNVDVDGDTLNDEQAERLHGHYGLERVLAATRDPDEIPELPREARDAEPPGLDDSEDNPLNQRRQERREELGIPEPGDSDGSTGDESPEERAEADTGADPPNADGDEDEEAAGSEEAQDGA